MLDFRMGGIGAPINGLYSFARTEQLGIYDKLANALALGIYLSIYLSIYLYVNISSRWQQTHQYKYIYI